jgi:group I intron endonuclease
MKMKITIQNNKTSQNNLNADLLNLSLNKSGVYLITNLTNGKKYVGSSAVLKRRYNEYSNPEYIARNLKKGNSKILNALIKYGYLNFEFKILETIDFNDSQTKSERRELLLEREQYYMNEIKPEYNINLQAGSNLGRTFSEEVRQKMSLAKSGKPGNKKGAVLSSESRALFREKSGMVKSVIMLNEIMMY